MALDPARLKAHREALGLSLEELAARAGFDRVTVWRMERGRSRPRSETIAIVAKALGVARADLERPASSAASEARTRTPERLAELANAERERGPAPPMSTRLGRMRPLTAHALECIYAAHGIHDGARFGARFKVQRQAALGVAEANALSAQAAKSARFELELVTIAKGALDVTACTIDPASTRAAQEARGAPERFKIALRVVTAEAPVFPFFGSTELHAWTFVIESIEPARR